jgi:hypothetical protein
MNRREGIISTLLLWVGTPMISKAETTALSMSYFKVDLDNIPYMEVVYDGHKVTISNHEIFKALQGNFVPSTTLDDK